MGVNANPKTVLAARNGTASGDARAHVNTHDASLMPTAAIPIPSLAVHPVAPSDAPNSLPDEISGSLASILEASNYRTAPNSPRLPPRRSNTSGVTPRVRPHATTLSIPGMTRSRISPDGRIAARDVGAKLIIIMVGLPARGKSYITKKLRRFIAWQQHDTRIFNVGNRRRVAAAAAPQPNPAQACLERQAASALLSTGFVPEPSDADQEPPLLDLNGAAPVVCKEHEQIDQSAKFFDPKNAEASRIREELALNTLNELLDYLLYEGGSVGILDATNSTLERRQSLVAHVRARAPKLGILFVESVCDDEKLLEANMRLKLSGPDYKDKDPVTSLQDFRARIEAYESAYVPLGKWEKENKLPFLKLIDVGRELFSSNVTSFLSNNISNYLSTFHLAPRQIWITRHGQSVDNQDGRLGGNSELTERGHCFAEVLYNFITEKRAAWLAEQKRKAAQASFPPQPGDNTPPYPESGETTDEALDNKNFCVWTSMMLRSFQTAEYFDVDDDYDVKSWEMLNELNAGSFEGMTFSDIRSRWPVEHSKRQADKLHYTYPGVGGEGYLQVISRLRPIVSEMERITDHVLVIGHRSVCRVLMAYFMDLTRDDITDMEMPLGMLYSIEPKPYGTELHAYRYNEDGGWFDELPDYKPRKKEAAT